MKKLLLSILLGMLLHKGLSAYYSYRWWTAEATAECRAERPEDPYLQCINRQLGVVQKVAPYVISYPSYTFKKWELRY